EADPPCYSASKDVAKLNPSPHLALKFPLITIMLGFIRAFNRHTEVIGLFCRELRKLDADLFQVKARDFFVKLLRQNVNADFVGISVFPEIQLREHLIGK